MAEDFFAALMMRRTLPTTTDLKTIKEPGIYPVTAGNESAPGKLAGSLMVFVPTTSTKQSFFSSTGERYFRSDTNTDWSREYSTLFKPTAADVNAYPATGGELKGAAWSSTMDNYRIVANGIGTFWRFDGSTLYLMFTDKNNPLGSWNSLRPLMVNPLNGEVSLGPTRVNGNLFVGDKGAWMASDGNIWGTRWNANGQWLWDAISQNIQNVLNRANDAWNKANDAQVNRVTADWVNGNFLPRGQDQNTIGTFAMAWSNTGDVDFNTVVSGGNLFPSTADGSRVGWTLPGAWRCCGAMRTTNDAHRVTLWQRVA